MAQHQLKQRPDFASEDEEREFWATHELSDYFDFENLEVITKPNSFPNLKRTEGLISLHLDAGLTKELKGIAKEESVDLAALAIQYLREGARRHAHRSAH